MSQPEQDGSGMSASIKLPWEWAMRPRPALPLLPSENNGMRAVTVTCVRCGRTSWRDEVTACACRRGG